ncbi:hypothetical protein [Reichenbachiella sp. MALMAid0571]|uniref:hypothetical protein n=1 Tax=Reichenbachiella sp. MALMAid0571 TaxID=3143939 RepID=UPI0032DFA33F
MKEDKFIRLIERCFNALLAVTIITLMFPFAAYYFICTYEGKVDNEEEVVVEQVMKVDDGITTDDNEILNGVHVNSGLIEDKGYEIVFATCTKCHSAKLVTQNRATREGWESMIRWMQRTQKLWDLGENETLILDYLSKNYAPEKKGRRAALSNIEWYELKD